MPKKLVRAPFPGSDANNKPVNPAPVAPERGLKAADLRPYIGKRLELVWGLGSQQHKEHATGKVVAVSDRYMNIAVVGSRRPNVYIPLSFLVRFSEVFV